MRGWLGLVIGLVVGAGAMYLVLRPPWGGGATAPPDAQIVAALTPDAGAKPKPKKRKRPQGTPVQPGDTEIFEPEPPPLTDADRRLEWRGDAVAVPPRTIDMTSGGEARTLETGEINATVNAQATDVQTCVQRAATDAGGLKATISIELVVDGNGHVTKSRLQAPHFLFEKGLLGCAQRALGHMRFPATGAPTLVRFPVNLS